MLYPSASAVVVFSSVSKQRTLIIVCHSTFLSATLSSTLEGIVVSSYCLIPLRLQAVDLAYNQLLMLACSDFERSLVCIAECSLVHPGGRSKGASVRGIVPGGVSSSPLCKKTIVFNEMSSAVCAKEPLLMVVACGLVRIGGITSVLSTPLLENFRILLPTRPHTRSRRSGD